MSQLKPAADQRQALVEDAAAAIGNALRINALMQVAFRQVVERHDLGEPWTQISRDMDRIEQALRLAQSALRPQWEEGQARRWDAPTSVPDPDVLIQSAPGVNHGGKRG
jgi:hypothetical protein